MRRALSSEIHNRVQVVKFLVDPVTLTTNRRAPRTNHISRKQLLSLKTAIQENYENYFIIILLLLLLIITTAIRRSDRRQCQTQP